MDITECQSSDICVYTSVMLNGQLSSSHTQRIHSEKHKPAQKPLVHQRLELGSKKVHVLR